MLNHGRHHRSTHQKTAGELDVDDLSPHVFGEFGQRHPVRPARKSRIVDQDINPAEFLERGGDGVLHRRTVGDVGDQRQTTPANAPHLLGRALNIPPARGFFIFRIMLRITPGSGNHNIGSQFGQGQSRGPANPAQAPRPGDNRDFSIKAAHHALP